jgi:hypothetical protein
MRSATSESMAKAEVIAQLTAENTRPETPNWFYGRSQAALRRPPPSCQPIPRLSKTGCVKRGQALALIRDAEARA